MPNAGRATSRPDGETARQTRPSQTIGILHCGELGAALATMLMSESVRVVTTNEGRSSATVARCESIGIETVQSVVEVVEAADIIMSVVLPDAAVEVAHACAAARPEQSGPAKVYLDVNSIGTPRSIEIERVVGSAGFQYVAGAVRGGAERLRVHGAMYLSGQMGHGIADLFDSVIPVRWVPHPDHSAKDLKLLMGGVAKGVNLLMLDLAVLATHCGLYDDFRIELADFYPDLSALFERFAPTFPRHALRRTSEMDELVGLSARHRRGETQGVMLRGAAYELHGIAEILDPETETLDRIVHDLVNQRSAAPEEGKPK